MLVYFTIIAILDSITRVHHRAQQPLRLATSRLSASGSSAWCRRAIGGDGSTGSGRRRLRVAGPASSARSSTSPSGSCAAQHTCSYTEPCTTSLTRDHYDDSSICMHPCMPCSQCHAWLPLHECLRPPFHAGSDRNSDGCNMTVQSLAHVFWAPRDAKLCNGQRRMKWPGHRSTNLGTSSANVERVAGPDKPREFLVHVLRAAHLEALRPLRHTHLRLRHLLRKMSPACTKMWKALLPSSRNAYTAVGVTSISYSTLLLSDDVGTMLLLVGGAATRDVSAAWDIPEKFTCARRILAWERGL